MIVVDGLVHAYGTQRVLHDLTFDVPAGAVYGFIGPNGAGKTTTLRILATLLAPTGGTVRVDGHDVLTDPDAVRRVLGYMPDLAGVYDRVTAHEYLDFFAAAQGIAPDRRARTIANVVELTDIGPLLGREVSALSKGQKQRMLLARTLLHDPKVLVLDEPASDLDPRARIELRLLLGELGRLGKTIVLSSHILTELADVCTWIGIVEHGRMVASGPIGDVHAQLRPGRRVRIAVLDGVSTAASVLATRPGVVSVQALESAPDEPPGAPGVVEVTYDGDAGLLAGLVAALVAAGVPVVGVEPERHDLERIFLDVTGRRGPSVPPEAPR